MKRGEYTLDERDTLLDVLQLETELLERYVTAVAHGGVKGFRQELLSLLQSGAEGEFRIINHLDQRAYLPADGAEKERVEELTEFWKEAYKKSKKEKTE